MYMPSEQQTSYLPYIAKLKANLNKHRQWGHKNARDVWPECAVHEEKKEEKEEKKEQPDVEDSDMPSDDGDYDPSSSELESVHTQHDETDADPGDEQWRLNYIALSKKTSS